MSVSLIKLLNDPSMLFDNERLVKKIEAVKKDKMGITNAASDYNNRYKKEIDEGTEKTKLLIENGSRRGLKEEDVLKQVGYFVPTVRTPILNFLYFMLREENLDMEFENVRKSFNKQYGHLEDDYIVENNKEAISPPPEMETFIYGNMSSKEFQTIKKLKTLALGGDCNENESALAFTMCKKLCEKFGLEFDKIPVNNE